MSCRPYVAWESTARVEGPGGSHTNHTPPLHNGCSDTVCNNNNSQDYNNNTTQLLVAAQVGVQVFTFLTEYEKVTPQLHCLTERIDSQGRFISGV